MTDTPEQIANLNHLKALFADAKKSMEDRWRRDEVLDAFHEAVDTVTPEVLKEWTTAFPEYADDFRAHAVEIADMELLASVRTKPLSNDAAAVMESIQELGGCDWLPYREIGQELLDHGLVAQTIHPDGKVTYRLTAAGKAWRAA